MVSPNWETRHVEMVIMWYTPVKIGAWRFKCLQGLLALETVGSVFQGFMVSESKVEG